VFKDSCSHIRFFIDVKYSLRVCFLLALFSGGSTFSFVLMRVLLPMYSLPMVGDYPLQVSCMHWTFFCRVPIGVRLSDDFGVSFMINQLWKQRLF
jgi:hypothetical protein